MDGNQIRAAREARGMTQQELAKKLGVAARSVSNWERGETIPRNRMGMLSQTFGIPAEDITGSPLGSFSDVELISELLSRAVLRAREEG